MKTKLSLAFIFLVTFNNSLADETNDSSHNKLIQNDEIIELKQSNQVFQDVIKNLIKRIELLENPAAGKIQDTSTNNINPGDIDPEVKKNLENESQENSKLIKTAFEQRLSREGGMLLAKNMFIYEPSLSYSHSSYEKIVVDGFTVYPVLVVGDIVSEKVRRNVFINNHSFRLGLGHDTQLDLVIPLGYQKEDSIKGDGDFTSKETSGIGDISLGISHQLLKSHITWPDTVIAFNWKTTTGDDPYNEVNTDKLALGTGFNTYGISLTSMANSDPIVLFGGYSLSYTDGMSKGIGYVKPGITNGLNLGMALALNFDTSLSFNLQFTHADKTEINGNRVNGTDITTATFAIGLSKAKGDSYAVDIDLGIGLTSDSPDFQLTVSLPINI